LLQRDEDQEVRSEAVKALGKLGPGARAALPALVEILDEEKDNEVVEALVEIDPDGSAVAPLLLKRFADLPREKPDSTRALFRALKKVAGRSPEVANALLARTYDEDLMIRQQATRALSELKTEAARARLTELLRDADRRTRFLAAFSLADQQVFPDAAIPVFLEALQDEDNRTSAAYRLQGFGIRLAPAVPLLITFLKDRKPGKWGHALIAAKDALGDHLPSLASLLSDRHTKFVLM
jgi:HEAT repeat protein